MALTTAILVGEARSWLPDIVEKAKKLKVNAGKWSLSSIGCIGLNGVIPGWKSDADIGPLISKAAKDRVIGLVQGAKKVGRLSELRWQYRGLAEYRRKAPTLCWTEATSQCLDSRTATSLERQLSLESSRTWPATRCTFDQLFLFRENAYCTEHVVKDGVPGGDLRTGARSNGSRELERCGRHHQQEPLRKRNRHLHFQRRYS